MAKSIQMRLAHAPICVARAARSPFLLRPYYVRGMARWPRRIIQLDGNRIWNELSNVSDANMVPSNRF